jgi:hypothetical protein
VAPDDRGVEILEEADPAAAASVRRELEEVERVRDRQRTGEVGQEHHARLQRRDEEGVAARECLRELRAQFADATVDLLSGQVDLPDRVALGRELPG